MKSKFVAAMLALFFGWFGLHKFYLGEAGWGFVSLLFCWTCIPAIISFFEAIGLLLESDEEFNERYNSMFIVTKKKAG